MGAGFNIKVVNATTFNNSHFSYNCKHQVVNNNMGCLSPENDYSIIVIPGSHFCCTAHQWEGNKRTRAIRTRYSQTCWARETRNAACVYPVVDKDRKQQNKKIKNKKNLSLRILNASKKLLKYQSFWRVNVGCTQKENQSSLWKTERITMNLLHSYNGDHLEGTFCTHKHPSNKK